MAEDQCTISDNVRTNLREGFFSWTWCSGASSDFNVSMIMTVMTAIDSSEHFEIQIVILHGSAIIIISVC